jgi:hypothetical protein
MFSRCVRELHDSSISVDVDHLKESSEGLIALKGREVQALHAVAEAEGNLVIGERRVLGGVEGAEPQPHVVLGEASCT